MQTVKKILTTARLLQKGLVYLCLCATMPLSAQTPAWAKKAAGAVFTLKTFDNNGTLLASGNGFFTNESGEALSSFAPFKGASRAIVIDSQDKEWPVECLLGANDTYDVAKFKVTVKKATALSIAAGNTVNGNTVWLLPYSAKKAPVCKQGSITNAEQFQGEYAYYTISMQAGDQHVGCPILNAGGEVVGLLQPSANGNNTTAYAVSVRFASDLRLRGLSLNEPTLRQTDIPLDIPDQLNDAVLSLYVAASSMKGDKYKDYLERFIRRYPQSTDGYVYLARLKAVENNFQAADEVMKQALDVAEKKDDVHYQYAQLIYQKELSQDSQPYAPWSLDRALEEIREADRLNPQPIYRQLQAQILYVQQQYDAAYQIYMELSSGPLRNAEIFYAAAQCKLQQEDKKAALALLDSAVNTFSRPYVKTASPFLHFRAQLSMEMRRYQQAIDDMQEVVALEPNSPQLWIEKASYEVRLNLLDEAIMSASSAIRLAPQENGGYLLAGLAQCVKGLKEEGLQNLQKAKELGNSQAQSLIEKYSK